MASAVHRALCRAITITSANNTLIFREDGTGTDRTATVAAGTYFLNGLGDGTDIVSVLAAAMTTGSGVAATYTQDAYWASSIGLVSWQISTSSTSVCYNNTGTTLPIALLGITSGQSLSFAGQFAPDSTVYGVWTADVISSVQDPGPLDNDGAYHHRRPDGSFASGRTSAPVRMWPLLWEYVGKRRGRQRHETAATDWSWEQFWRAVNAGETMQLIEFVNVASGEQATTTLVAQGGLADSSRRGIDITRDSDVPTYRCEAMFVEDMTA